jgi:hypothetical protein
MTTSTEPSTLLIAERDRLRARVAKLEAVCREAIDYAETCGDFPEYTGGYCITAGILKMMKDALEA